MQGEREVKGVITWKSISSRLARNSARVPTRAGLPGRREIVEANHPLFDVIPLLRRPVTCRFAAKTGRSRNLLQ